MQLTIATLATALQTLFTTTAEQVGRATGWLKRRRCLTAADFAQTLVLGWIDDPRASLESFAGRLDLSPQALHQRCTPAAQDFLRALLAQALAQILAARRTTFALLRRFSAVIVEDTTTLRLPPDLAARWPGSAGTAALKVLVRFDLLTGQLLAVQVVAGTTNDAPQAATAADLPTRALHLADLGFFDAGRWQRLAAHQYWISRVPASVAVRVGDTWRSLAAWLATLPATGADGPVALVERQGVPCRLTARRCPPAVAARRRQKLRAYTRDKKGREPSQRQLVLCDWLVLATNVPAAQLTPVELWVVYRCRWQIELLFKRGKQQVGWSFSHGRTGNRVLVEVLAKLLGLMVVHWATLLRGGPLAGVSPVKLYRVVRRFAWGLAQALRTPQALVPTLQQLQQELARVRGQPRRRQKPSTRQLLQDPTLAA